MNQSPEALAERSVPGLHAATAEVLARHAGKHEDVLDLGGGSGSWARRLTARGFRVTVLDREPERFGANEISFVEADLNRHFAAVPGKRFPIVTAIEVIEHLENPRHFLRQARRLVAPGGIFIVTTPNIECLPARVRFLLKGELRFFTADERFSDPTHITPIHTQMFSKMCADTGWEIVEHTHNTPRAESVHLLNRLVCRLLEPITRGELGGDNHIYVLRRSRKLR